MYNLPKSGYTVNITKEKFLNTYPPLFNPVCLQWRKQAGFFTFCRLKTAKQKIITLLIKRYICRGCIVGYFRI